MTALLERLTQLELIYRMQSKEDARVKKAGLTPKAIKLIDNVPEVRFAEADEALQGHSSEEKMNLSSLLKKLLLSLFIRFIYIFNCIHNFFVEKSYLTAYN